MPASEAHVRTDRSSRYLVQLCRHASQMGQHRGHRPRTHLGGETPPEVLHVEWSDTDGTVKLSLGEWSMQATPDALILRAEASDAASLHRVQQLLTARLDKIGRRDGLSVSWRPVPASAAQPGEAVPAAPAPGPAAATHRGHRWTSA